jgi:AAA family ATP:ADP antiporter
LPLVLHGFAGSFVAYGVLSGLVPPLQQGVFAWDRPECLLGATFYSWVTSFVVCGVALVWVHAVDHFTTAQGKRLFGLVSVGGTLGAIVGSALSWAGAELPRGVAMVAAAALIEGSLWCYRGSRIACERMAAEHGTVSPGVARIASAGVWRGLVLVFRSPYLLGIAGFVVLSSVAATAFYYQLNALVAAQIEAEPDRRSLFAGINLFHNLLALWIQLAWTGPVLVRLGLALVLCVMPAFSLLGLSLVAVLPAVGVMAAVEVARRTLQFAFDKPAREVLFTPLGLEEKYKSKAFLDTAVLRLGDLLGALVNDWLLRLQVTGTALCAGALPALAAWAGLGFWLGRRCRAREGAQAGPAV